MEDIPCCQRTLYSYVDKQYLSVINLDLPRKVRYKKRKKKQLDTPNPVLSSLLCSFGTVL